MKGYRDDFSLSQDGFLLSSLLGLVSIPALKTELYVSSPDQKP